MIPTIARATVCVVLLTLFTPEAASATPKMVRSALERRADVLYSARAKRRFAIYLRLKLLELRKADLDRAALVVQGRLGVEGLFPSGNPLPPAKDARRPRPPRQ